MPGYDDRDVRTGGSAGGRGRGAGRGGRPWGGGRGRCWGGGRGAQWQDEPQDPGRGLRRRMRGAWIIGPAAPAEDEEA